MRSLETKVQVTRSCFGEGWVSLVGMEREGYRDVDVDVDEERGGVGKV